METQSISIAVFVGKTMEIFRFLLVCTFGGDIAIHQHLESNNNDNNNTTWIITVNYHSDLLQKHPQNRKYGGSMQYSIMIKDQTCWDLTVQARILWELSNESSQRCTSLHPPSPETTHFLDSNSYTTA